MPPTQTDSATVIPYGRQSLNQQDLEAVLAVLQSDWLTQGPAIERFEKAVAEYCGAKYAVAVSSATAGLHIAALALGLEPGKKLWTVPNTFVASANCARYCGAEVDFVDIHPKTYNIDVQALAAKLAAAEKSGRLPDVVVPVHFAGQSCEMAAIYDLSKQYGFSVMEDAAHAIGGSYRRDNIEEKIGSCRFSDLAVFSFHPVKVMTTGEGGMIVTNRSDLYEKLLQLRSHGITRDARFMTQPPEGAWSYEQLDLGFNYRMTDMQAALGYSQLQRLDRFIARRHERVARYNHLLQDLPITRPWQHPDTYSAYHLYPVRVAAEKRKAVFDALRAENIGVQIHYIPVHTQPYYQALGFGWGDYPQAEQYYRETISLPLYYDLTEADQDRVVSVLSESLKKR